MLRWMGHAAGVALMGCAMLAPVPSPAAAQTTFAWPSDTGDVARYETVEECLAATSRVRSRVEGWDSVWADTLALTPARAAVPLPQGVIETAKRCGARLGADTMPVKDFAPLFHLYLLANRDADAEKILRRRLAAVNPKALRERAAVLDSAVEGHLWLAFGIGTQLKAQPVRLAVAESLLTEVGRYPDSVRSVASRLTAPFQLLRAAKVADDVAMVRRVADRVLEINDRLTSAEKRDPFYASSGTLITYLTLATKEELAAVDSLKRGTMAYVALKRAAWAKASGEAPEALRFPIGERAAALRADAWFGRPDAAGDRPAKGKVSLVVFLDYDCRYGWPYCWPGYAALHRLSERFPSLEITIAARTHGYFSEMAPPSPSEEAKVLNEWWRDFHKVPGALAVTGTDFWRLDAPDRRRVDRPTPNETNYSFGRTWQAQTTSAFLVDQDGIIVEVGNLGMHDSMGIPDVEEHFARLIEVLLARSGGKA